jgi:hypothetical protein
MSLAFTPQNASSTLEIDVELVGASTAIGHAVVALFQDATANALAAVVEYQDTVSGMNLFCLKHVMTAGTTSATTFKVRAGKPVANTFTFNGSAGTRYFGGVMASRITITEYLP